MTVSSSAIPPQGALRVDSPEGPLLLYRDGDRVTAHSARCTHFGVPMKAAHQGGVVTCWFHGAQFDLRDGKSIRAPLSRDWQNKTPLRIGLVAGLVIPVGRCKALKSYTVNLVGDEIRVSDG